MPDRYQEEIEEILKKADGLPPGKAPVEAESMHHGVGSRTRVTKGKASTGPGTGRRWPTLSTGKVFLIGLVLLIVGALWIRPLVWVGLAGLVAAYLLFFVKPRSGHVEKRWRGQSMEEASSPWERFVRWLRS